MLARRLAQAEKTVRSVRAGVVDAGDVSGRQQTEGTLVYLGAAPAVTAVQRVVQLSRAGDLAAAAAACRDLEQEAARLQLALAAR